MTDEPREFADSEQPRESAGDALFDASRDDSQRHFGTTRVVGRRARLFDIIMNVMFLAVLGMTALQGQGNVVIYGMLALGVFLLFLNIKLFIWPINASVEDGRFCLRAAETWSTPAANVEELGMIGNRMCIRLHDPLDVQPGKIGKAFARKKPSGSFHAATMPQVFTMEQSNALREALGMPRQLADHVQERRLEFEARLRETTPRLFVTSLLIAANLAVFVWVSLMTGSVIHPDIGFMLQAGANFPPLTTTGEWWRILTAMFLHFGVIHLVFNMWILRDIGQFVERLVGNTGFAVGYVLSGFGGGICSAIFLESSVSAGASGAIFGVFGMLLGFLALHRGSVPPDELRSHRGNAIAFMVFNIVLGFSVPWIDMAAHLGGFATGFVCGLILSRDLNAARPRVFVRSLALAATGAAACVVAVRQLPERPPDLNMMREELQRVETEGVDLYNRSMQALQSEEQSPQQVAERIRERIAGRLPGLMQALKRVPTPTPEYERYRDALLKYLGLREQGWRLIADAVETNSLYPKGLAVRKFEAANSVIQAVDPSAVRDSRYSLWDEIALIAVAASDAGDTFQDAFERHERQLISNADFADIIEREVLPRWRAAQQRFLTARPTVQQEDSDAAAQLTEFLELQIRGFRTLIQAERRADEQQRLEAYQLLNSANAIWNRLLGVPDDGSSSDGVNVEVVFQQPSLHKAKRTGLRHRVQPLALNG